MASALAAMAGLTSAQGINVGTSPASPATYGQAVTLTAVLADTLGGVDCNAASVFFYVYPVALGFPVGTATPVVRLAPLPVVCIATLEPNSYTSNLPVGTQTVQAVFESSAAGFPTAQTTLVVNQAPTTISLTTSPNPSTVGQIVTLTATLSPNGPTGTIDFLDGANKLTSATRVIDGGVGVISVGTTALTPGKHSLTVSYSGDTNYLGSTSTAVSQTVNQIVTTTSLQAVPTSSNPGQSVTLTAMVSPSTATGKVTFLDGSTNLGTTQLSSGTASISTTNLSSGNHSLFASYGGDTDDAPSISSPVMEFVTQPTTTALAAAPNPSVFGQNVTLTSTVTSGNPTGTVSFFDGASLLSTVSLDDDVATFSTATLSVGSHSLTASYSGDTNYAPSVSSAVTETVNKASTTTSLKAVPASSTPGQTVALTATVAPSTATGTVTFLDGSTTIGTAGLTAGTASFSISSLSTGNHSLTASYGGDANDAASVSPAVTESVGLLTTTTTLTATPNPSVFGQNVTLTATVSPGNPTGTVSFLDGANLLGTSSVANGVATLSISTLSGGSHSLTAVYSGDTNNATSTSAAVNESVTGGTGSITPNPVSASPASGSGSSQVMIFTFNDASGWQDLDVVNILINNVLDGRNACYLAYSRSAGVLYLVGDNGGTLSTGLVLGGSGSVSNSQCIVAGAASAASGSGNTLTVTLNLIFAAGFGGNKVVYLAARDLAGGNSGWQALGVWQVTFTPAGTIAVVSLIAARGAAASGTAQTLTATLTDSQGAGDFGVVNVLVNNFIDGRSACYLAYAAASNSLLLVDDAGDAGGPFAGGMVLNGTAGTIQNSQCSVSGVGSSAVKSGNMLKLTLNVTFQAALTGNRVVWVAGRDGVGGNNTDWQAMGTTTVQ